MQKRIAWRLEMSALSCRLTIWPPLRAEHWKLRMASSSKAGAPRGMEQSVESEGRSLLLSCEEEIVLSFVYQA